MRSRSLIGWIDAEIGDDRPIERRRRQQADLVFSLGGLRQRALEDVLGARNQLERQLPRALALAFDLDRDLFAGRHQPGVGEAYADLDRLAALITATVGLDLCLAVADQARTRHEADRLHPEAAEVAVAHAEPPSPGVVERVEHHLAGPEELVDDQR